MTAFLLATQDAIFTRLDAALPTVTIYDDPPGEEILSQNYPYIVIGLDTAEPWETDDTLGANVFATLHIWTRYQGKGPLKTIQGQVYDLLNRQADSLVAAGYRFVDCLHLNSEVLEENDGSTRHGLCQYRITVEKE